MRSSTRTALTAAALVAGGLLLSPAAAGTASAAPASAAAPAAQAAPIPLGGAGPDRIAPGEPSPEAGHQAKPDPARYVGKSCPEAKTQAESDGYKNVRVVKPGQVLTQEYMPDRLTLHCSAGGTVEKAAKG
ncbi:I78 family peptidase inhibitor [Streptomyces sp. ODS28]|uniref:I78 family peptidase inhibitor n=1 Tax=Streptomyces sp. ODS28 TaxID=3136688 RepID=UPI0031F185D4